MDINPRHEFMLLCGVALGPRPAAILCYKKKSANSQWVSKGQIESDDVKLISCVKVQQLCARLLASAASYTHATAPICRVKQALTQDTENHFVTGQSHTIDATTKGIICFYDATEDVRALSIYKEHTVRSLFVCALVASWCLLFACSDMNE